MVLAMRRTRVCANRLVALSDQERRRYQHGGEGYDASVVSHFSSLGPQANRISARLQLRYRMLPIRFLS